MPIKDLTPQRRLPRGGHIRLGEMKKSAKTGNQYPSAVDYFIADFDNKDHEALFYQIYGEKPKRIKVCFGHNDPEKVFPQYYKCYGQSGLKCKGDGETAGRWIDGELVEVDCVGPDDCPFAAQNGRDGKPGCKRLASLQVFVHGIPELCVFQINTTSRNTIINVNTGLELLDRLTNGNVAGTWVWLRMVPMEVQAEGKKKTVHVLDIEIPVGMHNVHQLERAFSAPLALPAPSDAKDPYLMPANGFAPDADAELAESREPAKQAEPARQAEPVTHKAEVVDLADDPDVIRAFEQSGLAQAVQQALLASAREHGWSQTKLLETIFAKSPNGGAREEKPPARRPASTAKPAQGNGAAKPAHAEAVAAQAEPATAATGNGRKSNFTRYNPEPPAPPSDGASDLDDF